MTLTQLLKQSNDRKSQVLLPVVEDALFAEGAEQRASKNPHVETYKTRILEARILRRFLKEDVVRMKRAVDTLSNLGDRKGLRLYPSSVSACVRAVWLKHFGMTEALTEFDPAQFFRKMQIFEFGDFFHLRMQVLLQRLNLLTAREEKYELADLYMSGRRDGRYDGSNPALPRPLKYEFKSINSRGFAQLKKVGPQENYLAQIQCDLFSDNSYPEEILLYENKDTQEKMEFVVTRDAAIFNNIKTASLEVVSYVETAKLPARPVGSRYEAPCRFCGLANACWNNLEMKSFESGAKKFIKKFDPVTGEKRKK